MTTAPVPATIEDLLQHAAWARRLARSLVGDPDDAEDVVQESLLSTLRAGPEAGASLLPWMRQVVRNRALTHRRDRQRRRRRDEAAAAQPTATGEEDPEASLSRMQAHRLVTDLVAELPEPLRQTIILRYYDGLDSVAIGIAMGVPPGTARWRLQAGIEQLRQRLDRRHQGDRAHWMRALVPLSGLGSWPHPRPRWLMPVLAVGALLVGVVVLVRIVWPGLHARSSVALATALARTFGADAASASKPRQGRLVHPGLDRARAVVPGNLPACLAALASVRKEIAAIGSDYRAVEDPVRVFADGAPNPAARAQLLPGIERLFTAPGLEGFTWDLDCHTWSCHLRVIEPEDADSNLWMRPLQADARLNPALPGMYFSAGRPTRDPISGKPLVESTAYLYLGKPGPDPADAAAAPDGPAACGLALQADRARLTNMRGVIARDRSPFRRYDVGKPNPTLTATLSKIIDRVLGADVRRFDLRIDCRGDGKANACRLQTNQAARHDQHAWRDRLEADPEFHRYSEGLGMDATAYFFSVGDPTRPQGIDFVSAEVRAFRAGPALAACATAHPDATGVLEVRLVLRDDASAGAMTADFGGTLADTPIGRCVQEALGRSVLAAQPPPRVTNIMTFARFEFPLPK